MADPQIAHLLRRAGFGASADDLELYSALGLAGAVDLLVNYEQFPDDVDANIGAFGFAGTTSQGQFRPNTVINDARQRWLFRMVHSQRPLQEKMTLFWHNHFATAYSKISQIVGGIDATRMLAAKPSEDVGGMRGQIELLRDNALGNFRDLLVEVAKDVAMNYWLDGRTNTKARPQENFGRELMELFTRGVNYYTEEDVYAAARVFTGWNSRRVNATPGVEGSGTYQFFYNAAQHETSAKTFSFPIYGSGSSTIPARSASAGMQDGLDLITALAGHRETAVRLARKLWYFFVSEIAAPDDRWLKAVADVYLRNKFNVRPVLRTVLTSRQFLDPANYFSRYSWPVEFVVRAIKEVGWNGFSVNSAVSVMANLGQQLFEPPDVAGWETGPTWFSTGSCLARMNFAATLTTNQRVNLANGARGNRTPEQLLAHFLGRLTPMPLQAAVRADLLTYIRAGSTFTGTDAQLRVKAPQLVHLIVGAPEYQLV